MFKFEKEWRKMHKDRNGFDQIVIFCWELEKMILLFFFLEERENDST